MRKLGMAAARPGDGRRRTPLIAMAFALLLAAAGCGRQVPPVPESARGQTPHGGPERPWLGDGRIRVEAFGRIVSARVIVRALPDGQARMAILSDEGLLLLDVRTLASAAADQPWYQVEHAIEAVAKAVPHLARLLLHAYGHPPETRAWDGDVLVGATRHGDRIYGGDPILLRAVEGGGLDLALRDWRPVADELAPWEVVASGPLGISVHLRLHAARRVQPPAALPDAPPPQHPAP